MAWIPAAVEFGEIMGMGDIIGEIGATNWAAGIPTVARSPTIAEAATGIIGIGVPIGIAIATSKTTPKTEQGTPLEAASTTDTSNRKKRPRSENSDSDEFATNRIRQKLSFSSDSSNSENMSFRGNPGRAIVGAKRSGMRSGRFKLGSKAGVNATEGEEVPVVPAPSRISKGVPDYHTAKLTYFDRRFITWTTTGLGTTVLRLNSIFDPDLSGVGHQPYGRDHFAGIYKYYRVLSCDVELRFINHDVTEVSQNAWQLVGYELTDDIADIYSDWQTFVEGKHSKSQLLAPNNDVFDGLAGKVTTMNFHYEPTQWDYHVMEQGTEERWTPIGTNPTNQHYMAIHACSAGNTTSGTTMLYFHMSFTVQFREITDAKHRTGS